MSFAFFIAHRYLHAQRKGFFSLLTTLIAVGGMALGVAALITTLAVMNGFHQDIRAKILNIQPTGIILPLGSERLNYNPETVSRIQRAFDRFPGVIAWSPFVLKPTVFQAGNQVIGGVLKGINLERELRVTNLADSLEEGDWSELNRTGDVPLIFLGRELARNFGIKVGDSLVAVAPGNSLVGFGFIPRGQRFRVGGIFRSGLYEYDAHLGITNLAAAQSLLEDAGTVSGIGLSFRDIFPRPALLTGLTQELNRDLDGEGVVVRSWLELNRNLFTALRLEKVVMFIVLTLIILVAAFNIVSNLLLFGMEKARDIGILQALGATRRQIRQIFLYEGLLMGGMGIGLGIVGGIGLSWFLRLYPLVKLPADIYYVERLPVALCWSDVGFVSLAAFLLVLIAAIYPAWRLSRVEPVEVIRYG